MEDVSGRAGRTMSYKYQRLRERLRQAISSGELAGKLPGERVLAKQFSANAKTLSKALTDLAAEGLLDRGVGRGTYVRGSEPARRDDGRWLVISDSGEWDTRLVQRLRESNAQIDVVSDVSALRPSFLSNCSGVVDCSSHSSEAALRGLIVRNLPVVCVGARVAVISTHSVQLDMELAAAQLARQLVLDGHEYFVTVEPQGQNSLCQTVRRLARRYNDRVEIDVCDCQDVSAAVRGGRTAVVCATEDLGRQALAVLSGQSITVPDDVSVVAMGLAHDMTACSGFYTNLDAVAESVIQLLRETSLHKPVNVWLAGDYLDRGTTAPRKLLQTEQEPAFRLSGVAV